MVFASTAERSSACSCRSAFRWAPGSSSWCWRVVVAEIIVSDRYLTREEKQEIWSGLGQYLGKLRLRLRGDVS